MIPENLDSIVQKTHSKAVVFANSKAMRMLAIVFTDLENSTDLKSDFGDFRGQELIKSHRDMVRALLAKTKKSAQDQEIETAGDSFLLVFEMPADAVAFSWRLLQSQVKLNQQSGCNLRVRIAIHYGQVIVSENETIKKPTDLYGLQLDITARILSLAEGNRILLSGVAHSLALQNLRHGADSLEFKNHGLYKLRLQKFDGPSPVFEVFEVFEGAEPSSPLKEVEKAWPVDKNGDWITHWRPEMGKSVPDEAKGWLLKEKLGEGSFGEVWRAEKETQEEVFKFCFNRSLANASLRREMRILAEMEKSDLGIDGIVWITGFHLPSDDAVVRPPFYVRYKYFKGIDLLKLSKQPGFFKSCSVSTRLNVIIKLARVIDRVHLRGIFHRDIKPSNILVNSSVTICDPNKVDVRLTDFGIGKVINEEIIDNLQRSGVPVSYSPELKGSPVGTLAYMAPQVRAGVRPSQGSDSYAVFYAKSDIYSLGVVLYQLVVGDMEKGLPEEWKDNVSDLFLREDIERCLVSNKRGFTTAGMLAESLTNLEKRRWRVRTNQIVAVFTLFAVCVMGIFYLPPIPNPPNDTIAATGPS